MERIVIKIGSRVLTRKDGSLNREVISNLVTDIANAKKEKGVDIILVTSGAVSTGKQVKELVNLKIEAEAIKYDKEIVREQILASVGQPRLMAVYIEEFKNYQIDCAQLLATRAVFADRSAYLSLRTVTNNLLRAGVVPIFNENDVLSPEELDFSDNDQLAYMIGAMIAADKVIILTDIGGLCDKSPYDSSAKVISQVNNIKEVMNLVDKKSGSGKGGMKSKLMSADLITSLGIDMHIASGLERKIITRIIGKEKIGTFFPAKSNKVKPLKNWLATAAVSEGKIIICALLADILRRKKVVSILFSGIEKIEGDFLGNEVIEICDDCGQTLGKGLVKFSAEDLKKKVQEFKEKSTLKRDSTSASKIIAVHYDYLVFV